MKLFTNKFKSGGLHEKHVVANNKCWEPSQHLLIDTGKPRKTCFVVASRSCLCVSCAYVHWFFVPYGSLNKVLHKISLYEGIIFGELRKPAEFVELNQIRN